MSSLSALPYLLDLPAAFGEDPAVNSVDRLRWQYWTLRYE